MIRVALRGLAGRKLRSLLTALAIVLGVAMVTGTYVLTDTIQKAFDNLFSEAYASTDVVVSGRDVVDFSATGGPTVPAGLLAEIRDLETVDAASGGIEDTAKIVVDGEVAGTGGAPTLAFSVDPETPQFNPLTLTAGEWPSGPDEVAIDKGTAEARGVELGEQVGIAARGPVRRFTVTGIARYGAVDSIGGATFALFDTETAQDLFGKEGRFDGIQVAAAPGVSPEQVIDDIRPLLPEGVQATTAAAQAQQEAGDTSEGIDFVRYFLLAFGGIALFVGAFVIFNTLSITIAQRTRELATLRTLGASRRQVLASILAETAIIGLVAAIVGIGAGVGLAMGLNELFVAFGIDLPRTATVIATRTIVVALAVGVGVAVVAGLVPALRATRVPPIAAVREGATLPPTRFARFQPYTAAAVALVGAGALVYGLFTEELGVADRLTALGAGVLFLFAGIAFVSQRLVRPLAAVLGRPAESVGGVAGRLARENARRNPQRTAITAAALMIGLALVTFVAVLGQGLRASVVETIERQVQADYVVSSTDFQTFPAAAGDALRELDVVRQVAAVRAESARLGNDDAFVTGVAPQRIDDLYSFDWVEGSAATLGELGRDGAIVTEDEAEASDLRVGETFAITTPDGTRRELVVRGIHRPPALGSLIGDVTIAQSTWDEIFPEPVDLNVYVDVRGGQSEQARQALAAAIEPFPGTKLETQPEFVESSQLGVDILLNMLYVLLALSVIVSLFGMVNTLVLSVFERTRELGMLRAIGMTRRQVRRMVRHESVITALIGAALGLPLGVFLAALVTQALAEEGVVFSVPVASLVVFAFVAVLAGIVAAVFPARRASRLNVLRALQYE